MPTAMPAAPPMRASLACLVAEARYSSRLLLVSRRFRHEGAVISLLEPALPQTYSLGTVGSTSSRTVYLVPIDSMPVETR